MNQLDQMRQFIDAFKGEEHSLLAYLDLLNYLSECMDFGPPLGSAEGREVLRRFRDLNDRMERYIEMQVAIDASFNPEFKARYAHLYSSLFELESRMLLAHSSPQFTCFVGCGSAPLSLLLFSKRLDACVFGLDIRKECVDLAQQFIAHQHQTRSDFDRHKILFVHSDGAVFDYRTSRNVLLSASMPAQSKRQILDHIVGTTRGRRIILLNRIPVGIGTIFYEECPSFTEFGIVGMKHLGTGRTGLLLATEMFEIT